MKRGLFLYAVLLFLALLPAYSSAQQQAVHSITITVIHKPLSISESISFIEESKTTLQPRFGITKATISEYSSFSNLQKHRKIHGTIQTKGMPELPAQCIPSSSPSNTPPRIITFL